MSTLEHSSDGSDATLVQADVASALQTLAQLLRSGTEDEPALFRALQELQMAGLSATDLRVHIERARAANDANEARDDVEDACILALDMIDGIAGSLSLSWASDRMAQVYLGQILTWEQLAQSISHAFEPSDLLPPRPTQTVGPHFERRVVSTIAGQFAEHSYIPQRADSIRVPKSRVTTRPAALLAPFDRVILEALADSIAQRLDDVLPCEVLWPRGRAHGVNEPAAAHTRFVDTPRSWGANYLIIADVESFYESVDHELLASALRSKFGVSLTYSRALRQFLDSVMGQVDGLPQGPRASDIFATAMLALVDGELQSAGRAFVRYADDYLIAAGSIPESRRILEQLEGALAQFGLRLNSTKTRLMRRETYLRNVSSEPFPRVGQLRERQREALKQALLQTEDEDTVATILAELGFDEEILWDIFYRGTVSIEDALAGREEQLLPPLVDSYVEYFRELSMALKKDAAGGDFAAAERAFQECLSFLVVGKGIVDLPDVSRAVTWFPRLAEQAALYFAAMSDSRPTEVAQELKAWISGDVGGSDWVTAWMAYAAESGSTAMRPALRTVLTDAAISARPLTRMAALWALVRSGESSDGIWESVARDLSPALRGEILLGWMAKSSDSPDQITS
ncbi:RNA-directed DNA polymerase [Cellulosimicrobium marinum]|uniref:RNA-directed DNA polymerase n=1 Tax=Cellulosimicrobium marinum TaxID=1638992 RepID=UPI001E3F12DC|nr:RNA-directed DNA polymerase [Cellulosimicrobium marinum]MCB7137278.1 RNA-directed DNA polymerase [Cellulosimicrobium marinum]